MDNEGFSQRWGVLNVNVAHRERWPNSDSRAFQIRSSQNQVFRELNINAATNAFKKTAKDR